VNEDIPIRVFKEPSLTPSGFFGSGKENIVELENFMTQKELDFLDNAARSINVWDLTQSHVNENGTVVYDAGFWKDRVASRPSLDKNDPQIGIVIETLVNRLKPIIENFFSVKAKPTGETIVKWLPGQLQHPHADKELHTGLDAGKPNDFPHYDIASLFYINDDYLGGELYFPNQKIQFKPKKGAAYFFPGDMNYVHGVTEVKESLRYTCPFFWEVLEHTGEAKPDYSKEYYRIFPEDGKSASWNPQDGIVDGF
jgi:hypothetical protein